MALVEIDDAWLGQILRLISTNHEEVPVRIITSQSDIVMAFTEAGTSEDFLIPADKTQLTGIIINGGGGGGSGRRGAAGTARFGGCGGAGGAGCLVRARVADLLLFGPEMTAFVASGGNGASPRTTDNGNGFAGQTAQQSRLSIGVNDIFIGGNPAPGGAGGTNAAGATTVAPANQFGPPLPDGAANATTTGVAGVSTAWTAGGGSGGSITAADAQGGGGNGGQCTTVGYVLALGGSGNGGAGGSGGIMLGDGAAFPVAGRPGNGGAGGGAGGLANPGGIGGFGGLYGGGGGGGGASTNGFNSGGGGAGGSGCILLVWS